MGQPINGDRWASEYVNDAPSVGDSLRFHVQHSEFMQIFRGTPVAKARASDLQKPFDRGN